MPPETLTETELTTEETSLLDYICLNPFTTQKNIALALSWFDRKGQPDTRKVRAIKEDLIIAGFPIGSTHGAGTEPGYFYINSIARLRLAESEYNARALRELQTKKLLKVNFLKANPTITLPPEQTNIFEIDALELEASLAKGGDNL